MDSAPTSPNPEDGVSKCETVQAASPAAGRSRLGRIVLALAPVLLGGGSVFSIVQWAVKGPQYQRQLNELETEQAQLQITAKQLENKATQQKLDFDNELTRITVAEQKRAYQRRLHDEAVDSLRRKVEALKQEKPSDMAVQIRQIRRLMVQLEDWYYSQVVGQSASFLQVDVATYTSIGQRQNR
jgi:hypothetical protein